MHDVAVVDSGPSWSRDVVFFACDHNVMMLEEHCHAGEPMQYAGLITDEVIRLSGIRLDVLSNITRAEVVFPDGTAVEDHSQVGEGGHRPRRRPCGSGFEDGRCDHGLGCEVQIGTGYTSHTVGGSVRIETFSGSLESHLLVGASATAPGSRDPSRITPSGSTFAECKQTCL